MSQQSSAKRPGGNQPSGSVRPDMIEEIARRVVARVVERADPMTVPVGVSVRHVHLSRADLRTLFGLDEFTLYRPVVQPGEFAATEMVAVRGPKGGFERVRCMGPCRPQSQVELSRTDAFALGVDAPVTQSGHLEQAGPIEVIGPKGAVHLAHGALVAARHLHCGTAWAAEVGLRDQQIIEVEIGGSRGGRLANVIVRAKTEWMPEVHLDTDEANALGVRNGDLVRLVKD